ncbi:MAG: RrF2 family transcriptional regulator [Dehalobacterium sp.]|jgi:Rrf2 family protein
MAGIVHISEMVSLALHSMVYIANQEKDLVNSREIAEASGCSEAHLVKTLQKLVRADFLFSQRGPKGGFGLLKPAHEVTLLDIFQAIEGSLEVSKCPMNHRECLFPNCIFGGMPQQLNQASIEYLKNKKVSDFKWEDTRGESN